MSNPKHDRQGVRKASDIEQKYNLSLLNSVGKGGQNSSELSRLNQLFSQYVVQTNDRLQKLENLYSVGSIYTTLVEGNPADIFGGEWELIAEGNILVGAITESDLPQLFQGEDRCFIWKRIA